MIRPNNQTEDLLLSITKNCETFHFNPPISIEGSWMIGLTDGEV